MLRWNYIIPRLVLLCCCCGVGWLALNPILRWALIQGGQSATGAKIEIGALRTLLTRAELRMSTMAVANPKSPMQNLFEAEHAEFDVDMRQLLRRRFVINKGRLGGIQLGTARESAGTLSGTDRPPASGPTLADRATELGGEWFENTAALMEKKIEGDLQSVQLARNLLQKWPTEYQQLESDTKSIRDRGRALVQLIKQTKDNPIQSIEHYQQLLTGADGVRRDTLLIQQQFGRIRQQMQLDRVAIEQAKQHDVQYIQQHMRIAQLDPETISNYLLGPEMGPRVTQLIQWLQWGRDQLPHESKPAPVSTRGWDVFLPGMDANPQMLVRKLLLDGGGTVDGQPFLFSGVVQGLTTQPAIYGKPATIEVTTSGSIGMLAKAVLDHSGEISQDRITIECPQLAQPERTLGTATEFAVTVSPGTSALKIDLDLSGDQLDGIIQFRQSSVNIQPSVARKLGGQLVQDRLSTATAGIQEIQAAMRLGGTLKRPSWRLNSNLGSQLANGLSSAFHAEVEHRRQQLLSRANEEIDAQVATLQRDLIAKQDELLDDLNLGSEELDFLKSQLADLPFSERISGKLMGAGGMLNKLFQR